VAITGTYAYGARRLRAPAFGIAVCFAAGIALAGRAHPSCTCCAAATLLLLTPAALLFRRDPAPLRSIIAAALAVASGALRYAQVSLPAIAAPCPGAGVSLRGTVIECASARRQSAAFTLETDSAVTAGSLLPCGTCVRVALRRRAAGGAHPEAGMRIRVEGRLWSLPGEGNPGEFDQGEYWRDRGISALMSGEAFSVLGTPDGFHPDLLLARIREAINREAARAVPGPGGELLKDLLTGDRSGIPRPTREAMTAAGVAHILAVSGYRVFVLNAMISFALSLTGIGRGKRALIAAPLLLFYMVLTGTRAPVVRATVMALVFMLGPACNRRSGGRNALGLAALVILVADPLQLFDAGFRLSFAAVACVQAYAGVIARLAARVKAKGGALPGAAVRGALLSAAATLGTVPLSAAAFGRVSLIGVITNIAIVPATGLAMALGIASLAAGGAHTPVGAAYAAVDRLLLEGMIGLSLRAASVPFAAVDTPSFGAAWTVAWYALLALPPMRRRKRGLAACTALLLAALNMCVWAPPEDLPARTRGCLRVTMIDVGQGDAFLVEFPGGGTILIDAGGRAPAFDAGKERVLPLLKRRNICSLDAMLITHTDIDHAGGAPAILRGLSVRELIRSGWEASSRVAQECSAAAASSGTIIREVGDGTRCLTQLPGRLYVVSPRPAHAGEIRRGGTNDRSLVVRVLFGGVSFLFTGDAGVRAERTMTARYGAFLRSTVLKVSHHGSAGATSAEFLDRVQPRLALVSVGRNNGYGHPSPDVIMRLAARGTRVLRTDCAGAAVLETDGTGVRLCARRSGHP